MSGPTNPRRPIASWTVAVPAAPSPAMTAGSARRTWRTTTWRLHHDLPDGVVARRYGQRRDHRLPRPLHHRAGAARRVPRAAARRRRRRSRVTSARRARSRSPTTRSGPASRTPRSACSGSAASTSRCSRRGPAGWATTSATSTPAGSGREHCNELIRRVCDLYPRALRPGVPAAAVAGRADRAVRRRARAMRGRDGVRRLQPQPRPERRSVDRPAALRPLLVPAVRGDGRARRPGDDPRQRGLQRQPPHDDVALPRRRHDRVHPADDVRPVRRRSRRCGSIIPHGGGAVPYHWGRFRGIAQDMELPPLAEAVLGNVWFDTCVYHQAGHRPAAAGRARSTTSCSPRR